MGGPNVKKPIRHRNISEWQRNNNKLATATEKGAELSTDLRFSSQQLRSEAYHKIHWNREDTNVKLTDRIIDIERWYLQLDQTLTQVEEQIVSASETKVEVESANTKKFPFSVAVKRCLDIRERRKDIDLLDDFVSDALLMESHYLDSATRQLREKGTEIWNHLCSLKGNQDKLRKDMKGKGMASKGEKHLRSMNLYSNNISFKHSPLEVPPSIVTEMQWFDSSLQKKQDAEREVMRGQELVNASLSVIRHTSNSVTQHREKTQQAMRRRIHQVESARDLLQIQKDQLLRELPKLSNEILENEKTIDNTKMPLKLAHTRLESRKWYPGAEICSDGPRKSLCEEVVQIEAIKLSLMQKLQAARTALNELHKQLNRVEKDLAQKEKVLELEKQSLDIHNHPHIGEADFHWIQSEGAESELSVHSSTAYSEVAAPPDIIYQQDHSRTDLPKMRDSLIIRRRSRPSEPLFINDTDLRSSPHGEYRTTSSQLLLPDVIPVRSLSQSTNLLRANDSSSYIPSVELLTE